MENQTRTGTTSESIVEITQSVRVPKVGDIVILHLGDNDPIQNNYAKELPAIITRVWSNTTVNLKGLPDGPGSIWRTSVMHQNSFPGAVIAQNPGWRFPEQDLQRGQAMTDATDSNG